MTPSTRVSGLFLASLLLLAVPGATRDLYPNFPLIRDCLYMCLICVERWGDIYNGAVCAADCERTLGKAMDTECSRGTSGKRYTEQEELCLETCRKCVPDTDGDKARMHKCYATCLQTGVHKVAC